ncbi:hypothetical protein [Bacillus sp. GM_Baccil_2]|uniref:hypothetical protein n=1 Tax=Bacillus sp. GM_Baccil_2 TaxID=2937369 RepID=UPI00226A5F96
MQITGDNYRVVDSSVFQGYLSRPLRIDTNIGVLIIYPIHVNNQNLYCAVNDRLVYVPLQEIKSVECIL